MHTNIDKQLDRYAKIKVGRNLNNLADDVNNQIFANEIPRFDLIIFMEKLFGMPFSISGSALASTLIVGILLGAQLQPEASLMQVDMLDLKVFSPINVNLPSSLLDIN